MALPPELVHRRYFDDDYDEFYDDRSDEDEDSISFGNFAPPVITSVVDAINRRNLEALTIQVDQHIQNGKSLDFDDKTNRVPLQDACFYGWQAGVSLLLEKGANPNVIVELSTPIFSCCSKSLDTERVECARLLIEHGADVNARNQKGMLPLMVACSQEAEPLVDLLLNCPKTDIHAKDPYGKNALFFAMESGNNAIIEKLIKAGIDPLEKCSDGTIAENHRVEKFTQRDSLIVSSLFTDSPTNQEFNPQQSQDAFSRQQVEKFLADVLGGFPNKAINLVDFPIAVSASLADLLSCDEETLSKRCGIKLSYYRKKLCNVVQKSYLQEWDSSTIPSKSKLDELSLQSIGDIVCGVMYQLIYMQSALKNLKKRIAANTMMQSQKCTLIELIDLYVAQRNLLVTLLKLQKELGQVEPYKDINRKNYSPWIIVKGFNMLLTAIAAPLRYIIFKLKARYDYN